MRFLPQLRAAAFMVAAFSFCAAESAFGQGSVLQSGSVTPGHCVTWSGNGEIQDAGATCAGAGSVAGSLYSTQYNAFGVFGGAGPGTTGQVLTSNGSGAPPSFQTGGGTYAANSTLTLTSNVFGLNLATPNTWSGIQSFPSGSIPNATLAHSATIIGGQTVNLGSSTANQGNGAKIQLSTGSTTTNDCVKFDASGNTVDAGAACNAGSGVTSVGLAMPTIFTVSGSPVTTTGTLTAALNTQSANRIFGGPTSGGASLPTFRSLVPADLPLATSSAFGVVKPDNSSITVSGGVISATGGGNGNFVNAVVTCGVDNTGVADVTTALNTCITNYGTVGLPAGTYKTTGAINLSGTGQGLIGAGTWATTINIHSTTAAAINMTAVQTYLGALNIDRTGVPTSSAYAVQTGATPENLLIENVHVQNHYRGFYLGPTNLSTIRGSAAEQNYEDGFYFWNTAGKQNLQWYADNNFSGQNNGIGFHVVAAAGAASGTMLPWTGDGTFGNTSGGFSFNGQSGAAINDIILNNVTSSADGQDGILIDAWGGTNNQINGYWVELAGQNTTGRALGTAASHQGNGIDIKGSGLAPVVSTKGTVIVASGTALHNSYNGIAIQGTILDGVTITGAQLTTNGMASAGTYDGISNGIDSAHVVVAGSRAFNESGGFQNYGYQAGVGTNSTISASDFTGNATAGCAVASGSLSGAGNQGTGCPTGGGGGGGVTSVAMTMPAEFSVGGSPITTSGTLAVTKANETANTGFYGPTSGGAAAPTFRAMVSADCITATSSVTGCVKPDNSTITISGGVLTATTGGAGTITGVTAGTNLSGGGVAGTVTLNVVAAPTFSGAVTTSGSGAAGFSDTGTETIAFKATGTHSTGIDLSGATLSNGIVLANTGQSVAWFNAAHSTTVGLAFDNTDSLNIGQGAAAIYLGQTTDPLTDNTFNLGSGVLAYANIYAHNALNVVSDRREKKDIAESDLGLAFIGRLKPVSFLWRNGGDEMRHYGLIAQDVAKQTGSSTGIVAVPTDPDSRYTVRYDELIGPLIKSVQELKADNDNLRKRIAVLEKRGER